MGDTAGKRSTNDSGAGKAHATARNEVLAVEIITAKVKRLLNRSLCLPARTENG